MTTLPEEWPTVEVRVGPYFGTDGRPLEGERVTFEPRVQRIVLEDETTIVRRVTSVTLDDEGTGVAYLPVSDDADLSSTGWTWQVRERFRWGSTFDIDVLTSDVAAGIDLADRAPVVSDEALGNWMTAFRAEMEALRDETLGGAGGGTGALITSAGGVVDLSEALATGATLFYRFTGAATVEGVDLAAGYYAFLRNPAEESGWSYWTINPPAELPVVDGGGGDPGEDVETTPQQPTWNDSLRNYVIANTTGVQYKKGGVNIAAGTYSTDSPTAAESVTITAVPKTGYVFPTGVATSWSHNYPVVTAWTELFADTLLTPTGTVDTRSGWTIVNGGSGADVLAIDATSFYVTGNASMYHDIPDLPVKHAIEFDYDLSDASLGTDRFYVDIARGVQPHRHMLRRTGSSAVTLEMWNVNEVAVGGYNLTALPITGRFRAESDGTYVRAFVNGTKIAEGPNDPALLGPYPPSSARLTARGEAVNVQKTRMKNVKIETQA